MIETLVDYSRTFPLLSITSRYSYESIQACQMMEELLGQVMAKLLEAQIHEEPSFGPFAKVVQSMQGKNNGKEEKQAK
ncbi:hypothetical protein AAG906_022802 [Vitis piasezkii]